jgi:hypothetical protein
LESQTLIFLHIPKTAGVSVSKFLQTCYHTDEIYHIRYDNQSVLAPDFSPHYGTENDFKELSTTARSKFRCLLGHVKFGIHEHIPGPSTYFTLIRDPTDRLVSQHRQYNKAARVEPNSVHRHQSFSEFWDEYQKSMSNYQIRFLCDNDIPKIPPNDKLLQAKRNLADYFCVCGTTERFDESLLVLSRYMGWPVSLYGKHNVSVREPKDSEISKDLLKEIETMNSYDKDLFNYANALLDSAVKNYGEQFDYDLTKLRSGINGIKWGIVQQIRFHIKRLMKSVEKH